MKKIFALLAVVVAAALISSCGETTTVSMDMPYNKYIANPKNSSSFTNNDAEAKGLYQAVMQGINDIKVKYEKQWTVPVSGSTIDEACAKADAEALADFDKVVAELKSWQEAFIEQRDSKDYGGGSFTLTYVYRVSRDKVLKESETITFQYPAKTN